MALDRVLIPVTFDKGIQTKIDEKLVLPTELTNLENGVFTEIGTINKRNGYIALDPSVANSTASLQAVALAAYNNELLAFDNQQVYAYADAGQEWVFKGPAPSVATTERTIIQNNYQQSQPSIGTIGNFIITAWQDSRGGVRYSVFDRQTNSTVVSDMVLNNFGTKPFVDSFEGYAFITTTSGSNSIIMYRFQTTDFRAPELGLIVATNVNPSRSTYIMKTHPSLGIIVAYNNNSGGTTINRHSSNITTINATQTITSQSLSAISLHFDNTNRPVLLTASSSTGVWQTVYNQPINAVVSASQVNNTTQPIQQLASAWNTGSVVFTEISGSGLTRRIEVSKTNATHVPVSSGSLVRGVGLAAQAFAVGSNTYTTALYESAVQPTYFLLNDSGIVASKAFAGESGEPLSGNAVSAVVVSGSSMMTTVPVRTRVVSADTEAFTLQGIATIEYDFTNLNIYANEQLANNLYIAGGVLGQYDGAGVVETGFHVFPEFISGSIVTGGGGLSAGQYQYVATYEWTDNNGSVQISAPSIPVTITPGASNQVQLTIPTLRVTTKAARFNRADLTIGVYRTTANGSTFYRVNGLTTYNDTTVDTITVTDGLADSAIVSRQILYTQGGEFENIAPPAANIITTFNNRIWLAGFGDENTLQYSKLITQGRAAEFNDALTIRVDPIGGPITALAALDTRLIVFKADRIFFVGGEGPDNLGRDGVYSDAQFITGDVGCIGQNSVVRTPNGIMFQTQKGIYSLDSSLAVKYVGDRVERFNNQRITAATLKPDLNQVRFLVESGVTLVYDYYRDQWSTFTRHEGVDAVIWRFRDYVYIDDRGRILKEEVGFYLDVNEPITMTLETAWMRVNQFQGFQRVYHANWIGEYQSAHTLRVDIGYDFATDYRDRLLFNPQTGLVVTRYGDDPLYGDRVFGGTQNGVYQFRVHQPRQKCQAVRYRFFDTPNSNSSGSGFSITGLTLEAGVKRGTGKTLPSRQNI